MQRISAETLQSSGSVCCSERKIYRGKRWRQTTSDGLQCACCGCHKLSDVQNFCHKDSVMK